MFCSCTVDDFELSDHSTVVGHFRATRLDLERFPWPRPDSVQWTDFKERPESSPVSLQAPSDVTECYRTLWQEAESSVQCIARARGKPLPDRCFGRGKQYTPTRTLLQVTPLRAGRSGDLRPSFLGFSQVHRLWFRQLRRLESYCRLVKHGVHTWQAKEHRAYLWNSILHAVGFRPSFASWWSQQGKVGTAGLTIPTLPPDRPIAAEIFDGFHELVRDFEKHLKKHQRHVASFKRASGLNAVHGEVKRDKPAPVSLFVPSAKGVVSHVDLADQALEFSKPVCSGYPIHRLSMRAVNWSSSLSRRISFGVRLFPVWLLVMLSFNPTFKANCLPSLRRFMISGGLVGLNILRLNLHNGNRYWILLAMFSIQFSVLLLPLMLPLWETWSSLKARDQG